MGKEFQTFKKSRQHETYCREQNYILKTVYLTGGQKINQNLLFLSVVKGFEADFKT